MSNQLFKTVCPEEVTGGIPIKSLKAFERLELKKGEKKTVSFTIEPEVLKVVNRQGEKVWRKGEYKIVVGNASPGDLSVSLGAAEPQEFVVTLK